MTSPKNLLILICVSSFSFAMQRERTIPKSQAIPTSNNPLDPYDCGYLDKMPTPDAALAKLAIEVAPVEIQSLTHHLATEWIYDSCKPQNLLLYGDSGTGKTTLAQAIAIQSGHPYSIVNCYWLGNETKGSTPSDNLYRIVNYALEQKQKPHIIILNDMDSFWKEDPIPAKTRTLRHLLKIHNDNPAFYFIGIATTPIQLNSYLGAFFDFEKIPLPQQVAREKAITYNMKALQQKASFQCSPQYLRHLSEKAEHFCFFYLDHLVKDAYTNAVVRNSDNKVVVTETDLEEALHTLQKLGKRYGLLPKTVLDHVQEHPYCAIAAGTATAGALIILARHLKNS